MSARDQQKSDGQWTRAKGHDTFCPVGPWIETDIDPADLELRTDVNGEVKQDSRTSLMIHDVGAIVEWISAVMTLLPGDLILTGTPAGVGPIEDGDTVNITISGIGTLSNPVVQKQDYVAIAAASAPAGRLPSAAPSVAGVAPARGVSGRSRALVRGELFVW